MRRVGLASLAHFFGVPTRPCHRALPDAEATAQVLVHLIGLAQELGARRLSDLRALAAPRKRRVYDKRSLAQGRANPARRLPLPRPPRPGALRRPRPRPARPAPLLLPQRAPAAVGRGGAARARPHRVARAGLRARGRARGAQADPRAAAAGQLTQPPEGARRLPEAPRRGLRRHEDHDPAGPDRQPPHASLAARALASSTTEELDALLEGGPLPRLRSATRAPGRGPPLRGGGPAPGPHRGARARRRAPAPAGAATPPRALPDRSGARTAGRRRSSSAAAKSAPFPLPPETRGRDQAASRSRPPERAQTR